MQKKKSTLNIYSTLVLYAMIPMITAVLILSTVLSIDSRISIESITKNYMLDLANEAGENIDFFIEQGGKEYGFSMPIMEEELGNISLNGMSSSYTYMVDGHSSTMLYHPTKDKIGNPVENDAVKHLVSEIKSGRIPANDIIEYKYKGVVKYAAYYIGADGDFIIIVTADESDVFASSNNILKICIGLGIGLTVFFIFLALAIAKLVSSPLVYASNALKDLADGKLFIKVEGKSHIKETNDILDSVTKVQSNLVNIVSTIKTNMDQLHINMDTAASSVETCNDASSSITKAIEEIASGTMDMAESVQGTATNMGDIDTSMTEIMSLVQNANEDTTIVTDNARDAQKKMTKLLEANKSTLAVSESISRGIEDASEAIQQITVATNMITSIAAQTNMLSLNASIEAARAGEAGRGFAVVASEISKLATQSDDSAREIQEIVRNIVEQSEQNSRYAVEIKEAMTQEDTALSDLRGSFDEVAECINRTVQSIHEIKEQVTYLEEKKDKVLDETSSLSAVSEENAAATQESNASIEELCANIETINVQTKEVQEMIRKISDAMAYFKLTDTQVTM